MVHSIVVLLSQQQTEPCAVNSAASLCHLRCVENNIALGESSTFKDLIKNITIVSKPLISDVQIGVSKTCSAAYYKLVLFRQEEYSEEETKKFFNTLILDVECSTDKSCPRDYEWCSLLNLALPNYVQFINEETISTVLSQIPPKDIRVCFTLIYAHPKFDPYWFLFANYEQYTDEDIVKLISLVEIGNYICCFLPSSREHFLLFKKFMIFLKNRIIATRIHSKSYRKFHQITNTKLTMKRKSIKNFADYESDEKMTDLFLIQSFILPLRARGQISIYKDYLSCLPSEILILVICKYLWRNDFAVFFDILEKSDKKYVLWYSFKNSNFLADHYLNVKRFPDIDPPFDFVEECVSAHNIDAIMAFIIHYSKGTECSYHDHLQALKNLIIEYNVPKQRLVDAINDRFIPEDADRLIRNLELK